MPETRSREELGQYMYADPEYSTGKTWVWSIRNRRSQAVLGYVKWYGSWRQYCFFPSSSAVFNADCLAELRSFVDRQNRLHRAGGV